MSFVQLGSDISEVPVLVGDIKILGMGFGDFHHHEVILEHLLVVFDEALG